ncbi:MAG: hypothetical protein QOK39_2088, partial [Acidimicrobiaceae bacterium]|nr:hypothetical protein [Acidimicrobiaceae bacterium]
PPRLTAPEIARDDVAILAIAVKS